MTDPRMLTEPVHPPYEGRTALAWLAAEVQDHLWPWRRGSGARALQFITSVLALAASAVWVLAALGWLGPNAIIASWFGWSVLEVAVRLSAKPYVKEGPWWQRRYRAASLMDLLCYVSFKNLLIGAVLFIGLKSAGLLVL